MKDYKKLSDTDLAKEYCIVVKKERDEVNNLYASTNNTQNDVDNITEKYDKIYNLIDKEMDERDIDFFVSNPVYTDDPENAEYYIFYNTDKTE